MQVTLSLLRVDPTCHTLETWAFVRKIDRNLLRRVYHICSCLSCASLCEGLIFHGSILDSPIFRRFFILLACDMDCSLSTCCCAGFGIFRQKITGTSESIAFLAAGGTLVYRKLEAGEQVIVDSRSVLAIEDSVKLGIISNGRFCTCCCGGEGCFSTTLTGPGSFVLQDANNRSTTTTDRFLSIAFLFHLFQARS